MLLQKCIETDINETLVGRSETEKWEAGYSCTMSSSTFQSSNELSGRYRLMTRGIFFAASSLSAISSGSVSPSTGTRTGAFILDVSWTRKVARSCAGILPPPFYNHQLVIRALSLSFSNAGTQERLAKTMGAGRGEKRRSRKEGQPSVESLRTALCEAKILTKSAAPVFQAHAPARTWSCTAS